MFQRTAHYVFPRFQEKGLRTVQYVYHGYSKPIHVLQTLSEVSILILSKLSFEFGLLDYCGGGSVFSFFLLLTRLRPKLSMSLATLYSLLQ